MAGENVTSPPSNPLHQAAHVSVSSSSSVTLSSTSLSSQQQQATATPVSSVGTASSLPPALAMANNTMAGSILESMGPSSTGGLVGVGSQQFCGPQQTSQGIQQNQHQSTASVPMQCPNVSGQHMSLQPLHQQQNPSSQLHATNVNHGQGLGQSQQSIGQSPGLNPMNFQQSPHPSQQGPGQNQQQKQTSGARPQQTQYAQTLQNPQLNSGSMQVQQGISQAASPAMVQSPPGTHAIPRTSSAQRLMQIPQGIPMPGVRTSNLGSQFTQQSLGSLSMSSMGNTIANQQMLLAQRAVQAQGVVAAQQRPLQPVQVSLQNQQHSSLQGGQIGATAQSQVLHQQFASSAIMGSSSARPLYTQAQPPFGVQYPHQIQQQQMGGLSRPGMAGQGPGHSSMLSVQPSQLSGLQSQFSPQQGRQKQSQVQPTQFSASVAPGQPLQGMQTVGTIGSLGTQQSRPTSSLTQQQQQQPRMQQALPRPQQQQQQQQQQLQQQQQQQLQQQLQQQQQQTQQPSPHQASLTSPQKLQAQQSPRVPSLSSVGSQMPGLSASPQASAGVNSMSHPQQQKQIHQQPLAATLQYAPQLQQQQVQQRQVQASHSQQPQQQQAQQNLVQQQQAQHLHRTQQSAIQRPLTPTGSQPGATVAGTATTAAVMASQPSESGQRILGKRNIQELVAQVDPNERLDPEVEDILLDIADDFIESVTTFACKLAKHRKSNELEAKDVLLHLNRNWEISIPGYGGEEYRAFKRPSVSDTHKQRLALVKRSITTQPTGQETGAAKGLGGPPASASAGSQAQMAAQSGVV